MLRDRRELMEHDIKMLTDQCGHMYLEMIRSGQSHTTPEYDALLDKLITMEAELKVIEQMIANGHQ